MLHRIAISPQGSLGLVATASEIGSPVESIDVASEIIDAFNVSLVGGLVTLAIATTEKPKAKLTKQVAKARVVVTRKKRVAVSDKPGKASAKQAKR